MNQEAKTFVNDSGWGRHLDRHELQRVLETVRQVDVAAGDCIVRDGEPAECWVGLIDGLVLQQVSGADGRLAALTCVGPGTWFGEGTLMKRSNWQYDAVARRRSRVVLVPCHTFDWLLDSSLPFNHFVSRLLNERLSRCMGLLASERLGSSARRLAHVLADLFDADLHPGRPSLLRMSQSDIALLSGMSRQNANTALQRLQSEGLVEVTRSGVQVLDPQALRAY